MGKSPILYTARSTTSTAHRRTLEIGTALLCTAIHDCDSVVICVRALGHLTQHTTSQPYMLAERIKVAHHLHRNPTSCHQDSKG